MLKSDSSARRDEITALSYSTMRQSADVREIIDRQRLAILNEVRTSIHREEQAHVTDHQFWDLGDTQLEQITLLHRRKQPENRSGHLTGHECFSCGRHIDTIGAAYLQKGPLPDLSHRVMIMCSNADGYEQILTVYLPCTLHIDPALSLNGEATVALNSSKGRVLSNYLLSLARALPTVATEHLPVLNAATCALVQACLSPTSNNSEHSDLSSATAFRERVRRVVRREMSSPEFGPEILGRLLAMSRSKLYRAFESTGGVARFIQQERLSEARRRLADISDNASIRVVASETGFLDHSTFSRAFKLRYGSSPSKFRELALARSLLDSNDGLQSTKSAH
jgi:AraC-like DNA-binding protein